MDKTKKIIVGLAFALCCVLIGVTLYRWIRFGTIDGGAIFFSCIALTYFFNALNWGDHEGKGGKDELAQHIKTQSAKIGYYVLMILSGLILFVSEGVSDLNAIKNYPLLIVVCLTFIIPPVVEFFYIRKYK